MSPAAGCAAGRTASPWPATRSPRDRFWGSSGRSRSPGSPASTSQPAYPPPTCSSCCWSPSPCETSGYTVADAVCYRFDSRLLRGSLAVATPIISIVYMVIQFVGAGLVAQLLFGIDDWIVVLCLGAITTLYTVLGGMIATTYIQMFKAALLLVVVALLVLITISRTGWNPVGPLLHARRALGDKVIIPLRKGGTTGALENVSLSLGLVLGFMGLPHVILRFLTARDGRAARDSVRIAMWIFVVFFLVLIILGHAALNEVGPAAIAKANKAGNLAAPQLAKAVGGELLFSLVAAIVIATVLAVLASLAIASSGAVAPTTCTRR